MKIIRRIKFLSIIFALIITASYSCNYISQNVSNIKTIKAFDVYTGTIISVTDGDTVKVSFDNYKENTLFNETETIRLIGVNTPELNLHKEEPAEYYSEEARNYTNQYYQKKVLIQLDHNFSIRDKYSRLLAYIYSAEDKAFINYDLIKNGYGIYYDAFLFDSKTMELFEKAEIDAKKQKIGIWFQKE
jgi:micrococcal nuclease